MHVYDLNVPKGASLSAGAFENIKSVWEYKETLLEQLKTNREAFPYVLEAFPLCISFVLFLEAFPYV